MTRIHHEQIAVRLRAGLGPRHRRELAESCHLAPFTERHRIPGERFSLVTVAPGSGSKAAAHGRSLAALARHPHVVATRVVGRHHGARHLATDRVWVAIREGHRPPPLGRVRETAGGGRYLLELPAGTDPEAACRRLARRAEVRWAEPDRVILGRRHGASGANARLAVRQYCLEVTRTRDAWRIQRGDRAVVVAIADCGVMLDHPDLRGALVAKYDATGRGAVGHVRPWDSHGTGCAGLAVGTHRTAGGVKGVASGCGLMVVRVGYTPTRDGDYLTKTSWLCRGIEWAWRHGAAVLSMSFGGGPRSRAIAESLDRARRLGRNGRGCVLVAAAGNAPGPGEPVEFPASLPFVMGVGATNLQDRPQTRIDAVSPWVSKCGPGVDIAAPGVNSYTCTVPDRTEDEPALYFNLFSGTSASTPLVAGAAALVLSADPSLTEAQVRSLLCATADRVGGARYVHGRNDQVGFGRLNVLRAVRAARAGPGDGDRDS